MIGLFEPDCKPWQLEGIPDDFSFGELPPDWDRLTPFLEKAMERVPIAREAGIRKFFCGPESFTPDLAPVMGEAPELRNYFVAAGLNSVGIITGGGYGRVIAHWILNGKPDVDVTGFNIESFFRLPVQSRIPTATRAGIAGAGLRLPFPGSSAAICSRCSPLTVPRASCCATRALSRREWLGVPWLVRPLKVNNLTRAPSPMAVHNGSRTGKPNTAPVAKM